MAKILHCVMVFVFAGTLLGAVLVPLYVESAGGIVVNTTNDELSKFPNGLCSLREAIENANHDNQGYPDCALGGSHDVITLPAGKYTLDLGGPFEDDNQGGDLDIKDNLVINGDPSQTVIQAGTSSPVSGDCLDCIDRVLEVHGGVTVAINDVVIRYGQLPAAPPDSLEHEPQDGGGIYNAGSLYLNNCSVMENQAGDGGSSTSNDAGGGGYGGGIYSSGDLTLNGSGVISNRSGDGGLSQTNGDGGDGGYGGGIYASAALTLHDSQVVNNETGDGGEGGYDCDSKAGAGGNSGKAGGIYCLGCTLIVENATISENMTGNGGDGGDAGGGYYGGNGGLSGTAGGLYIASASTAVFTDTTISTNQTGLPGLGGSGDVIGHEGDPGRRGSGGGIYFNGGSGSIYGSTLDHNAGRNGGGIYVTSESTLQVTNTTITLNQADASGGGIAIIEGGASTPAVSLFFVTVVNNKADIDGNGDGGGGGIMTDVTYSVPLTLTNTLVVSNIVRFNVSSDCWGGILSADYNLLYEVDGCQWMPQDHDLYGPEINLGIYTLGDYGGPTETHPLASYSDSINWIPVGVNGCGTTVLFDQRGVLRSHNCDIGAVEYDQAWRLYLPLVMK